MFKDHKLKRGSSWLLALVVLIVASACGSNPESGPVAPVPETGVGPATEIVDMDNYEAIRYVSQNAGSDATGDGSSDGPWQSLGHALSQIADAEAVNRYALLVAEGTYSGETVQLKEHLDLYGGFDPATWERNIFAQASILDGEGVRRVVIGADNTRLDGFVVRGGQVRGPGGGLFCEAVSPIVTNNVFLGNKTLVPEPWNPEYTHETAHDGGAIYCFKGASPLIEKNLFSANLTEAGRGAGIACHDRASPRISRNVFISNTAGVADPMRSSDGGAISAFMYSDPVIERNVILNNSAPAKNDGGGVFVALWSSAVVADNVVVGNHGGDDAGGLFVGGQEHRYDEPLDPLPAAEEFFVQVTGNLFMGNSNPSQNSGAMRFTMEGRGVFANNVTAHNNGIYFQRSEVTVMNNTILDDFLFVETKEGLKPGVIANNIIWAGFQLETETPVLHCDIQGGHAGPGNIDMDPMLEDDRRTIEAGTTRYDEQRFLTEVTVPGASFQEDEFANRVVQGRDKWSVVKSNGSDRIMLWGDFSGQTGFDLLPEYHLQSGSPCLDKGTSTDAPVRDRDGDVRPAGAGVDMGADEHYPSQS